MYFLYTVYKLSLRIWDILGCLYQATSCKQQNIYAKIDNIVQRNSELSIYDSAANEQRIPQDWLPSSPCSFLPWLENMSPTYVTVL